MKRSQRLEKMASVYDAEILPLWTQRFGQMVLRGLDVPPKATVLDVGCATGYPTFEVLKRTDGGRNVAIETLSPLLDVARGKAGDLLRKRIFFRSDKIGGRLIFADEVFDLAYSNVDLATLPDPPALLKELTRVARPGARVLATLSLRGTFAEFYDIYREVLVKHDKSDVLRRLEDHAARAPEPDEAVRWMKEARLGNVTIEVEEFKLLFKSSREFFFAPVIEYGPLREWKEIGGKGEEMQQIFWHIKEAIDTYFGDRAFEVTVKAGCLRGRRPGGRAERSAPRPDAEKTVEARGEDARATDAETDDSEIVTQPLPASLFEDGAGEGEDEEIL